MGNEISRSPARDKAMMYVAQAMREAWGSEKLARVAQISNDVARDVLGEMSRELAEKAKRELGFIVEEMREVAMRERPSAVMRLESVGSICDAALTKAREMLASIENEFLDWDSSGGENPQMKRILPEDRLATLSGVIAKLAGASAASWAAFKDASGIALAERIREAQLIAEAKAKPDGYRSAVDVEVIFPDDESPKR